MAKQTINIGSTANDGTGSTLRVGGDIINDNFNEIYPAFGDGSTLTAPLTAAGTWVDGGKRSCKGQRYDFRVQFRSLIAKNKKKNFC